MKTHYNVSEKAYQNLIKRVSVLDLVELVPLFSPTNAPVTAVSLMLVYDKFGNFLAIQNRRELKVAKAVFDSMDADDKVSVMMYINEEQELEE